MDRPLSVGAGDVVETAADIERGLELYARVFWRPESDGGH